jgi:hypothetical protein
LARKEPARRSVLSDAFVRILLDVLGPHRCGFLTGLQDCQDQLDEKGKAKVERASRELPAG